MTLLVSAFLIFPTNAESCVFSLDMLKGRSSESTTPLMKRHHSGSMSGLFGSTRIFRE